MSSGFDTIRIDTERLILRAPRLEDFDAWASFAADDEATRFVGGVQSRPLAWRSFAAMVGCWHLQGFAMFSVIDRTSGRWLGRLGPFCPEGWPGTEVGWSLARDAWGNGYATEGAVAATDWAFDTLGWSEVIHTIDPSNASSIRVAERLGSAYLGPGQLPPPFDNSPVGIWGQTRQAWLDRRRSAG